MGTTRSGFQRRWLIRAVMVGAVVAGFGGSVRSFWSRWREREALSQEVRLSRRRLARKEAALDRALRSDAYIEREARRALGLVRPDEREYRFSGDSPSR
jgi:cell division protein FtsB